MRGVDSSPADRDAVVQRLTGGKGPLRVLITRLSHIGDCILTLPILNALRAGFPDAHIQWVVERPSACLLEQHEALDDVIVLQRGWLKSFREVCSVRRRLRRQRFHVSIDSQCLTKSSILGWLAGAKTRIGFGGVHGRELSRRLNNCLVNNKTAHVVSRGLELLEPLGIQSPTVDFRIPVPNTAHHAMATFLGEDCPGHRFVAINPGAGWDSRLWPTDRYAAVARHLGNTCAIPSVVVWAGDRELHWARQIVAGSAGHARLAPPTSLLELAALLERATLFVGSDTGPMHLAVAMGTRCVSLHGPTLASQSGPFGEGHCAIQQVYLEGSCRERRRANNDSMKLIHADRVSEACDRLLSQGLRRGSARHAALASTEGQSHCLSQYHVPRPERPRAASRQNLAGFP